MPSPYRNSDLIVEGHLGEWLAALKQDQNFFKHADRDPDATLDFVPEATPFHILEAVLLHGKLGGRKLPETVMFISWFWAAYPDTLKPGAFRDRIRPGLARLDPTNLRAFRTAIALMVTQEKAGMWPPTATAGEADAIGS